MKPAKDVALSEPELAQLGLLTVILGQVDDMMVQLVAHFLKVDREAANIIMGSSKVGDNSAIWAATIRNRCKDEDVLWWTEHALKEIEAVSAARNDFIHAVFSDPIQMIGGAAIIGGPLDGSPWIADTPMGPVSVTRPPPLARRVRRSAYRSVSDLPKAVSQAGRLSCLIAHIDHVSIGNPVTTSPWHGTFVPALPPRLDTVAERKKKAQRGRPKSSRK